MTTTKIHRKLKFKQHETNTNMGMKLYLCSSLWCLRLLMRLLTFYRSNIIDGPVIVNLEPVVWYLKYMVQVLSILENWRAQGVPFFGDIIIYGLLRRWISLLSTWNDLQFIRQLCFLLCCYFLVCVTWIDIINVITIIAVSYLVAKLFVLSGYCLFVWLNKYC
jgi:hypothetical protein